MDGRRVLEFALHDSSARKQTDTFGNLFATENPKSHFRCEQAEKLTLLCQTNAYLFVGHSSSKST